MEQTSQPLVDLTTLNAVESLFHSNSPEDPWARYLAGELADFFIYADTARYALPLKDLSVSEENADLPSLLKDLKAGEPGLFRSAKLLTEQCGKYNVEYLGLAADRLVSWGKSNFRRLKTWTEVHNQTWVRGPHSVRVPRRYAIDKAALKDISELQILAKTASISVEDVWYALDVILRYPVYGGIAGPGNCYLNHPIRAAITLPTMQEKETQAKWAVSFSESISFFAHKLTQKEYVGFLLSLREEIRKLDIHQQLPGEFDPRSIRHIASKVGMPGRLKSGTKWLAVAGGGVAVLGAVPLLGTGAAIVGGGITVAGALWSGNLPRGISKVEWLKWKIEWPELEKQAKIRN